MTFEARNDADIVRLIEQYPLAWVVSRSDPGFAATPLPLLCETDDAGRVIALFGHFALSNPHVALLKEFPGATVLFSGPHGYISPELVSKPQWAPTWNYAIAQFDADIEFVPQENDRALASLVTAMEADRREPWTIEKMGARYASMVTRIVAFRAHVSRQRSRFKLGQDETNQSLTEIVEGLGRTPLAQWMRDFNADREKQG